MLKSNRRNCITTKRLDGTRYEVPSRTKYRTWIHWCFVQLRNWTKHHGGNKGRLSWCLRCTSQGVRIWLPNFEEFFTSLGRLLESTEGQRNTASYDSAEFFSRRFRENERTLVTLTLRIEEAFSNEVEVISDLNELVFLMNELSRDFDRIFEDSERSTFTAPSSLNDCLSTVARNGLVGRPRLQILQQELQTLHNDPGFRWADIRRIIEWEYCLWQNWLWQDIDMKGWSFLILLSVNSCVILGPTNHFYS